MLSEVTVQEAWGQVLKWVLFPLQAGSQDFVLVLIFRGQQGDGKGLIMSEIQSDRRIFNPSKNVSF